VSPEAAVQGITEADIANYLAHTPAFFERHAELLGSVELHNPHGGASSLHERQVALLREKIRHLEQQAADMVRHGRANVALEQRLHRWTLQLLTTPEPAALPDAVVQGLRDGFDVPLAALRLWGLDSAHADADFAADVGDDPRALAQSLSTPYCGPNKGFEAARWLQGAHAVDLADVPAAPVDTTAADVASLALVPLRDGDAVFGLLVLGSPDPARYTVDMGRELLLRIGELASGALARLRQPG
jgi:uncharacterized protein YigA (DUF484 family)